ncbi:hypothetical protein [uncultured Lamprocystis sp.]|uniref:hypothetical protein n=1 Tax=uncultured Lamprocystis sp. TaxID=543132 RepID=UPI0025EC4E40|nr:hypothetical protein [uncultured Lamprocystis sp.]
MANLPAAIVDLGIALARQMRLTEIGLVAEGRKPVLLLTRSRRIFPLLTQQLGLKTIGEYRVA